MARKKEQNPASQKALIDQLKRESGGPQALFDKGGLLEALKKRFIEQALEAEVFIRQILTENEKTITLTEGGSKNE